jgi:hypothetical protein
VVFQPVADEGGLLGSAFGIDHDRQIAAHPHRVHVVEEEGAMAAEQILDVVLGGRQQDVDAGILHQVVEPAGVERNVVGGQRHDGPPHAGCQGALGCPSSSKA